MSITTLNTDPVYSALWAPGGSGAIVGPSANTATDGTGANMFLIYTMDAADQNFIKSVSFPIAGTTAATVIRLWWLNNTGAFTAGTTNTAANTFLIGELAAAAWTASNTLAAPQYIIPVFKGFPVSTKLLVSFGTSTGAAGNGFNPFVDAGKY